MTTYKNIHGKRVKTFATDLDNEQAEGQIFFLDTANEFKTVVSSAAWSASDTDATEEYDGTNWTNGGNLNTTRRGFVGAGTLTAGIVYSGYTTEIVTNTEEYNGTAWTNATAINTARNNGAGSTNAPQSTALLFGGNTGSDTGNTEQYNGTTWTEVADMAVARDGLGGGGIGSTALAAFGKTNADVSNTEEFNTTVNTITGAAWSSGGNLGSSRYELASADQAPQTAGLGFGGYEPGASPVRSAKTEEYDGSSWTESGDLNTGRNALGGAGTQTAGLAFGGYDGSNHVNASEEYNGSSWTEGNNLNSGRANIAGNGTQTAALASGGNNPPGPPGGLYADVEEYNGTSWAEQNNLSTARRDGTAFGIQTAAVLAGGEKSGNAYSEED
jgi:hypothetical protein